MRTRCSTCGAPWPYNDTEAKDEGWHRDTDKGSVSCGAVKCGTKAPPKPEPKLTYEQRIATYKLRDEAWHRKQNPKPEPKKVSKPAKVPKKATTKTTGKGKGKA